MNQRLVNDTLMFVGLVALAVATRLVMLAPNFHAVTAAALFAGYYFRNRPLAVLVPLVVMTISNAIIGGYNREVMVTVYAALIVPIAFRGLLRSRLTAPRVAIGAVASSLVFFLTTNAAVWHSGALYSRGWDGLLKCYAMGVPFLYNALAGDVLFSAGLFGAYVLAVRLSRHSSHAALPAGA
jgi:hypothetical protein